MALSKTTLQSLIKSKVEAVTGYAMTETAQEVWLAVADAIVTHITTSGVVAVASVSGVTTGGGVSGPGTGTIT